MNNCGLCIVNRELKKGVNYMSKSLIMSFLTEEGKKASIRISNVKEGITDQEVKTAMETIIAKNIFTTKNGDLKTVDSAHIQDTSTVELEVK